VFRPHGNVVQHRSDTFLDELRIAGGADIIEPIEYIEEKIITG